VSLAELRYQLELRRVVPQRRQAVAEPRDVPASKAGQEAGRTEDSVEDSLDIVPVEGIHKAGTEDSPAEGNQTGEESPVVADLAPPPEAGGREASPQ